MNEIKVISTDQAAPAGGHYVQATAHNGVLYVSGQLPVLADGTHIFTAPFEEQAKQALNNLLEIIKAAGSTPSQLLKVTVYIVDIRHWPVFNKLYAAILGNVKPARSIVPVPELHYGYLIEIDAVAAIPIQNVE